MQQHLWSCQMWAATVSKWA